MASNWKSDFFGYNGLSLVCVHQEARGEAGLCRVCQDAYAVDPEAYLEYGDHKEGIRRWEEVEQMMMECTRVDRICPECHKLAVADDEGKDTCCGNCGVRYSLDYKPNHDNEIPF